jgi:hypothetical protein
MDDARHAPTLHLRRSPDGACSGHVNEGGGQVWFSGSTPEEIVAQWLDRYALRPHVLALTDEERDTLRVIVDREAKVEFHTTASPRHLAVLRALTERLR